MESALLQTINGSKAAKNIHTLNISEFHVKYRANLNSINKFHNKIYCIFQLQLIYLTIDKLYSISNMNVFENH